MTAPNYAIRHNHDIAWEARFILMLFNRAKLAHFFNSPSINWRVDCGLMCRTVSTAAARSLAAKSEVANTDVSPEFRAFEN